MGYCIIPHKGYNIQQRFDSHCATIYKNGEIVKMIAGDISPTDENNAIQKAMAYIDKISGKIQQITHPFFECGATLYTLPDGTHVFVYPIDDTLFDWNAWYTGDTINDVDKFLDECAEGEHSDLGSSFHDTWAEIMKQLTDFSND